MSVRALFWEETQARRVAGRLRSDGFGAKPARERFAGEDDDEDAVWVVLTDAPPALVEPLVEEHDGWLEETPTGTLPALPPAPLDLPDAPRRVKGHFDAS